MSLAFLLSVALGAVEAKSNSQLWVEYGQRLMGQAQYKEAIKAFAKVGAYPGGYAGLAAAYERLGDFDRSQYYSRMAMGSMNKEASNPFLPTPTPKTAPSAIQAILPDMYNTGPTPTLTEIAVSVPGKTLAANQSWTPGRRGELLFMLGGGWHDVDTAQYDMVSVAYDDENYLQSIGWDVTSSTYYATPAPLHLDFELEYRPIPWVGIVGGYEVMNQATMGIKARGTATGYPGEYNQKDSSRSDSIDLGYVGIGLYLPLSPAFRIGIRPELGLARWHEESKGTEIGYNPSSFFYSWNSEVASNAIVYSAKLMVGYTLQKVWVFRLAGGFKSAHFEPFRFAKASDSNGNAWAKPGDIVYALNGRPYDTHLNSFEATFSAGYRLTWGLP